MELALRQKVNRTYLTEPSSDQQLEARIRSFETAFGMQREAPEAFNFAEETEETMDDVSGAAPREGQDTATGVRSHGTPTAE